MLSDSHHTSDNTAKTEKWLLRPSPKNLCDKLLFQFYEWDMVEGYEAFVCTGEPLAGHAGMQGRGLLKPLPARHAESPSLML